MRLGGRRILVTGSAGHLGEALMRTLRAAGDDVIGIDRLASPFTDRVGTITDAGFVAQAMRDVDVVMHTATLHKPHVVTHSQQDFVDTNITGTLTLLDAAKRAGASAFLFTSTTSAFGDALRPPPGEPAAWITEAVTSVPKNIYGATKTAAEDLCRLFWRNHGLPALVLRTSRFFPEEDDSAAVRADYSPDNAWANEFPHRRAEVQDIVDAHVLAAERAGDIGYRRYIISATTPFTAADLPALRRDPAAILRERVPLFETVYAAQGWRMLDVIDRVYVNARAREELGWAPRWDFASVLEDVHAGRDPRSPLARRIGRKGYHDHPFEDGHYPVEASPQDECA